MSTEIKSTPCEHCSQRNQSAFCKLHNGALSRLAESKKCAIIKKGEVLFSEGQYPKGVFCINKGSFVLAKAGQEGRDQIVGFKGKSDLFGFSEMLGEKPYAVTAKALTPATVCFVPRSSFEQMLEQEHPFAQEVMKRMSTDLNNLTKELTEMAQKNTKQRLASALLKLYHVLEPSLSEDKFFNLGLSREELASLVGATQENVIRNLSELKKQDIIMTKARQVRIVDMEGLRNVAGLVS